MITHASVGNDIGSGGVEEDAAAAAITTASKPKSIPFARFNGGSGKSPFVATAASADKAVPVTTATVRVVNH